MKTFSFVAWAQSKQVEDARREVLADEVPVESRDVARGILSKTTVSREALQRQARLERDRLIARLVKGQRQLRENGKFAGSVAGRVEKLNQIL